MGQKKVTVKSSNPESSSRKNWQTSKPFLATPAWHFLAH